MTVFPVRRPHVELIAALTSKGIPVMGHLGLMPQALHATGGYKVQARTADTAARLVDDAQRIEPPAPARSCWKPFPATRRNSSPRPCAS